MSHAPVLVYSCLRSVPSYLALDVSEKKLNEHLFANKQV